MGVFLALRGKQTQIRVLKLYLFFFLIVNIDELLFFFNLIYLGVRPAGVGSQEHILPKHICKRMFNIFHPSDPIVTCFLFFKFSF